MQLSRNPLVVLPALLLALLLTARCASADERSASPPDAAVIVASNPVVTFRWPSAGGRYLFTLHAGNEVAQNLTLATARVQLRIAPGPVYRWTVRVMGSQGVRELVALRTFQISQDLTMPFRGTDGGLGESGTPGQDVDVMLQPAEGLAGLDLLVVAVQANRHQAVYLSRLSDPLVIDARGGAGGPGRTGADGVAGTVQSCYDGAGRIVSWYVTQGRAGENGEPGGAGGRGGTVKVQWSGVDDVHRHVRALVNGGAGGPGGRGGAPGIGSPYAFPYGVRTGTIVVPPPAVSNTPGGRDGAVGPNGAPGSFVY